MHGAPVGASTPSGGCVSRRWSASPGRPLTREKVRRPGTLIYRLGGWEKSPIDVNLMQSKLVAARKSGEVKPTDINGGMAGFLSGGGESKNHIVGADSTTSVTAALAAQTGTTPLQVPLAKIRVELTKHGAIVPKTA